MIGLKAQMDMMDPVLWDDLDNDLLKEKVLGQAPSLVRLTLIHRHSLAQYDLRSARDFGLHDARDGIT